MAVKYIIYTFLSLSQPSRLHELGQLVLSRDVGNHIARNRDDWVSDRLGSTPLPPHLQARQFIFESLEVARRVVSPMSAMRPLVHLVSPVAISTTVWVLFYLLCILRFASRCTLRSAQRFFCL